MNHSNLRQIISASTSTDWLSEEVPYVFTCALDVNINIEISLTDDLFHEEWTDEFADKTASRVTAHITYSGAFVEKFTLVSVDGGRHLIPFPTMQRTIDQFEHRLGEIVNGHSDDYDAALHRAGITVV